MNWMISILQYEFMRMISKLANLFWLLCTIQQEDQLTGGTWTLRMHDVQCITPTVVTLQDPSLWRLLKSEAVRLCMYY